MDSQQEIPDREQLVHARRRRDAGWKLIRQTFIEGRPEEEATGRWLDDNSIQTRGETASQNSDPAKRLPQIFEQTIGEADRLADQRQDKAELVAAREQLATEVQRSANKLTQLVKLLESHQAAADDLRAQWHELWKPCGLLPDSPETMQQWLRLHNDYLQSTRKLSLLESKCNELQRRIESFERSLCEAMGNADNSPQALLREAARLVELAREAEVERRLIEEKLPSQQRELDEIAADLDEIDSQIRSAGARRVELLDDLGFPHVLGRATVGKNTRRVIAGPHSTRQSRRTSTAALETCKKASTNMRPGCVKHANAWRRNCSNCRPKTPPRASPAVLRKPAKRKTRSSRLQKQSPTHTATGRRQNYTTKSTSAEAATHARDGRCRFRRRVLPRGPPWRERKSTCKKRSTS